MWCQSLYWFSTVALLLDGDFTDHFLFLFFCFLEMRTVAPGYITGPLIYKKTQPGTWLKLVSSMIHPLFTENLHNFLCILSHHLGVNGNERTDCLEVAPHYHSLKTVHKWMLTHGSLAPARLSRNRQTVNLHILWLSLLDSVGAAPKNESFSWEMSRWVIGRAMHSCKREH